MVAMKERRKVEITADPGVLVTELFKERVPEEFLVVLKPRTIEHRRSYGGISPFFKGLTEGRLLGTRCRFCSRALIWLPPRPDCPDCWKRMNWKEIKTEGATVYTYSVAEFSGAGAKGSLPWPLISVEIPGVWTFFMSYLAEFAEDEPYIGMPIRPVFRTENPTYTILDVGWVPVDD